MSDQEPQRCTKCGGLGAIVERYPVRDEDGYEYEAWRDVPCPACGGRGWI